jgi:peptidoglycan hydrolase-like protein with peptidoglycan-binding domain
MGSRYLTDLADVVRGAGLECLEVSGWQNRGRSSGGFNSPEPTYIMCHHTASGTGSDGWNDANYIATGSDIHPISQVYINREGKVWVCAAGACNNAGSGGPVPGVSQDSMNTHSLALEVANNGVGEPWPQVQQEAYQRLVQAFQRHYSIPVANTIAHFEWAPGRKIDPAGQSRWASGSASWNMNAFRSDAAAGWPNAQPQPPQPTPTPPPSEDWVSRVINSLPTLVQGNSNMHVKRMQHLLAAVGYMNEANTANYDAVFGGGTATALNKFKTAAGGKANGVCDQWTWGALMHTIDGIPTIDTGARGTDVKRMQHLLACLGYMNEGNVKNYDGVWGSGTDSAKRQFDGDHGLASSSDVSCGPKSWESLLTDRHW